MHISSSAAVYVISVAADLAGMHPQTLRQYDRLGLVTPERTAGRGRRYSGKDIAKLRLIQQLSQDEGVNLVGIKKIIDLQNQVDALKSRNEELEDEVRTRRSAQERDARVFAAGTVGGDVVSISRGRRPQGRPEPGALVLYNRYRRG
ncbi:MerR family transcriptional regulator, heat shock protein HspR [Brevibacterium siliguriense]|uniref:MerR family transcriptional regulator, heat shock protein HspR n=1 Tax=Brevibacterium siliguriense TaxID=1136497 RepID=A0A1H1P7D6_9MICO|nr:helix-turn-helix transcriptional regulator [Brevibacterium siliguriense]SDS06885.1 MerR family transcriptional regulator, heat shock protein HspR [Brevibacterium siliguriense]